MKFGIVGLGRMGRNIALQALEKGHQVVGFNRSEEKTKALEQDGLIPAFRLDELVQKLEKPRIVLIYLPHGDPTEQAIDALTLHMERADVIADGKNSHAAPYVWRTSVADKRDRRWDLNLILIFDPFTIVDALAGYIARRIGKKPNKTPRHFVWRW
jgi:6-phosphogluconate dehydrogenase